MYAPKFTITNNILKHIGVIDAAREVVENAALIPAYEKKFQAEAALRTVHHGTRLEGNDLTLSQAEQVMEGQEVVAHDRDIQEVINYRKVLDLVDKLVEEEADYSEETLKKLHQATVVRISPEKDAGQYRKTQVVIRNAVSGEVSFRPPPALEVSHLIKSFFSWINSKEAKEMHPVLRSGITHYVLAAVHPFTEGNGRNARAFATLVLFAEGYDIRKLFSLEEYFDRDAERYYQALQSVSNQSTDLGRRDLTPWLEYFCQGLAIELSRVKDRVRQLSLDGRLRSKTGKQVALTERQIKLVEYLQENGQIRMAEARKIIPMVSEDTLLRDLRDLLRKGIVKKTGVTKGAAYIMK